MKKIQLIFSIVSIFIATSAFAVKMVSLYQMDLPVSSQSDDERATVVRQGFAQLLVKLTGNPEIDKNPDIKAAIKRAEYYVQEFSYSAPTTNSATYSLHVTFEADDVTRLLRKSGIAFWGQKRPLILVWLTVTEANKQTTEIIGSETPGNILNQVKSEGNKYGLPLIFPMMDVADLNLVTPTEVTEMALPVLKQAGKRYAPNAYLLGTIEPAAGGYQSKWQLILNKDQWSWTIADKSVDEVIATVMLQASQVLSKYYQSNS